MASVIRARQSAHGWHEPERADGLLATTEHPAIVYAPSRPLLGQAPLPAPFSAHELRFLGDAIFPSHHHTTWSLSSAHVIGEEGTVYCPLTGAIVEETARTITQPASANGHLWINRPDITPLSGCALLMSSPFGHAHYHFLWEMLAKLAAIPASVRANIQHFLVSALPGERSTEWLRAAGVDPAKVIWLTPHTHLRCAQLLFSNLPAPLTQPRPAIAQQLRSLFPVPREVAPPRRWLWVSRRGLALRDLRWEEAILAAFPEFASVDLAALSAETQIRLFTEAVVVAGPHGSGLANLAFVPANGGALIEFFPTEMATDPAYARMAGALGWRHASVRVDFQTPGDTPALVAALRAFLAPASDV